MFSESMLSMRASKAEEPDNTDYLPALLAIGCAWLIALLRGLLGVVRHEGLDLDMALTAVVLAIVPLIICRISRTENRHPATPEREAAPRQRPRLVLISNR